MPEPETQVELALLYDERNEAVKRMVAELIAKAHSRDTRVGICGQAPSDYPEFAAFLDEEGIDSMSLHPDRMIQVKRRVAEEEASWASGSALGRGERSLR